MIPPREWDPLPRGLTPTPTYSSGVIPIYAQGTGETDSRGFPVFRSSTTILDPWWLVLGIALALAFHRWR